MPAAYVPMVIDQGEDFASQIVWTNNMDDAQLIVAPARLDIKADTGQTVLSLATPDEELPEGEIPQIGISEDIGLIQLYIPHATTAAMVPGQYIYDLFVTADDGDAYAGLQRQRILYGPVYVNKRTTQM